MEGIHTLKEIVRPNDWMVKVDLKNAYLTLLIHNTHKQYLRFRFQGLDYQFNCLAFGLSLAPWVFINTLKPAIALLRETGMRLIAYIDGILVLAKSKELLVNQAAGMCYLLENLGFLVNQKKSILEPSQTMEFLGFTVDTVVIDSIRQAKENQGGVLEVRKGGSSFSQIINMVNWENECHFSGNSPVFFVLPTFANEVVHHIEQGFPRLQNSVNSGPGVPEQTEMAGQPYMQVEREDIAEQGNRFSNRLREEEPHQLGTHGGNFCHSNICQEHDRHINSLQNRQHNGVCLHQQLWWNHFKRAYNHGKEPVDVLSGKEHTHHSPTPPTSTELNCRLRIKNNIDRTDWQLNPAIFR